jgi:hypothetical protein
MQEVYYSDNGGSNDAFLYIGNLKNAQAQSYKGKGGCPYTYYSSPQWSPGSKYFASQTVIDTVDGTSILVDGHFMGWIDASHYLYIEGNNVKNLKTRIGVIGGESMDAPDGFR